VANPRPFCAIKLRQILKDRALQEQVLASKLGITKSALSRKLNGSRPWKLTEMNRVANYLGMLDHEIFPIEERKR